MYVSYSYLVGGFNPSEKYELVSWDDDIPNCFWKVIQSSMVPVTTDQMRNCYGSIFLQTSVYSYGFSTSMTSKVQQFQPQNRWTVG